MGSVRPVLENVKTSFDFVTRIVVVVDVVDLGSTFLTSLAVVNFRDVFGADDVERVDSDSFDERRDDDDDVVVAF